MGFIQVLLLALLVGSAIAAFVTHDLLVSVIMFGFFSFFAALLYTLMMAVDVAFTEAVIGGITTIFYVTVLYRTKRGSS
jgi:energy-converting hydrogenase B subunit D